MSPTPVTTPSAARYLSPSPASIWSASIPSSTHVPGSRSRSSRSRTVSLLSECWRSTRSCPPMATARSRRALRSPTSGPQSWTSPPPVAVTWSSSHGEHGPFAGDALQCVVAALVELDAGTGNQIAHGARDEHLTRPRERRDAGADVHRDPSEIVAPHLALAGVHPRPNLDSELARAGRDRPGAVDRTPRSVEGSKKPVSGGLDLLTAEPAQLTADGRVVLIEQVVPAAIAFGRGAGGRLDDVREQHGLEHTVSFN